MGNPPKRVVMSKLIRRYFKRQGGIEASQEATGLKTELIQCWEQYGVDHPKCNHHIKKFDRGWALELEAQQRYKAQVDLYPTHFNNMMTPKIDKMFYKGTDSSGYWLNNKPRKMPKYWLRVYKHECLYIPNYFSFTL